MCGLWGRGGVLPPYLGFGNYGRRMRVLSNGVCVTGARVGASYVSLRLATNQLEIVLFVVHLEFVARGRAIRR